MKRIILPLLIFFTAPIPDWDAVSAGADNSTPNAQELMELAPVITSTNEHYEAISFTGTIDYGYGGFALERYWSRNQTDVLIVRDLADGTPIMMCANEQSLIYNSEAGVLQLRKKAHPYFYVDVETSTKTHTATIAFGSHQWNAPHLEHLARPAVHLDFASFFASFLDDDIATKRTARVRKLSASDYQLVLAVSEDSQYVARFDLSNEAPLVQFAIEPLGWERPWLEFSEIRVNEDAQVPRFRLPSAEALSKELPVEEWNGNVENLSQLKDQQRALTINVLSHFLDQMEPTEILPSLREAGVRDVDLEDLKRAHEHRKLHSEALKRIGESLVIPHN